MRILSNFKNPTKRVLCLGYDEKQTSIIKLLINNKCNIYHTNQRVFEINTYDFVVSFGYRHILKPKTLKDLNCPIFNLHMSYLPYNKGAHPNFWSFYDKTPSGVTLHIIDNGIDTGPIVAQKQLSFNNNNDTFLNTYKVLKVELEKLFEENLQSLLSDTWVAKKQKGKGTKHRLKDLPVNFSGWESNIKSEICKLYNEGLKYD